LYLYPLDIVPTIRPYHTGSLAASLLELFSSLSGVDVFANENTPQYKAYQWIATTDTSDKNVTDDKLTQRYAATVVHYALGYSTPLLSVDECLWPTLACNETTGNVSEINLARSSLIGSLPTELGLLTGLRKIDLAQNQVVGSIPDSFYVLSDMQFLYLESNQMTGTLSELIDNTRALEKIFLGDNNFSGPLPLTLRSRDEIRPLRECTWAFLHTT
jgi:Leucine-rich repeat (LRR) protein